MSYETVRDAAGNVLLVANFHEPIPLVALTNFSGTLTCAAEVPFTVGVIAGDAQLVLPNTPTLTLSGDDMGGHVLAVIAGNITTLEIPVRAGGVILVAPNLATLTFTGALVSTTAFSCVGSKLNSVNIERILAAVSAAVMPDGALDLSGGTNAAPVLDVAASPGSFSITLAGTPGAGDYFTAPDLVNVGNGAVAFWMSVDGNGAAPDIDPSVEVLIDTASMSVGDMASAIAAQVNGNGRYSASTQGDLGEIIIFAAVTAGARNVVVASGFTIGGEETGDNAHNSNIQILMDNNWTVVTN